MSDSVELLARDDKWSLGAGDGALYAPRYPLWLDAPGFWDEATIHQYAFAPLFTVTLLDEHGTELALRAAARRWTPAELMIEYRLANGVTAVEVRTVQPGGVFASEWRLRALRPATLHLVAWTAQDASTVDQASVASRGGILFRRRLTDRWGVALEVEAELGCAGGATTWAALLAEPGAPHPGWRYSPFPTRWGTEGLPRTLDLAPAAEPGAPRTLYAGVHRTLVVDGDSAAATFAMRVVPADPALRTRVTELRDARVPRAAAEAADEARADDAPSVVPPAATLGRASRQRWQELLARTPRFACSDPYLEAYVRYRWAGLWTMLTGGGAGEYERPLACEGPGEHHLPSAAATPALVRELRWLRDPALARAALRAFAARVDADGAMPAWIALQHVPAERAASAAWGDALLALDAAAPDAALLAELWPALDRHARWLERRVEPALDARREGGGSAGARETVAAVADLAGLLDALAALAPRVAGAVGDHAARATRLRDRARARLWDGGRGVFHDGEACTAAGFFLYGCGVATREHAPALERAVADPALFGTPYPLPTEAGDPGTGRVEPAVSCRAAHAIARYATDVAPELRPLAARLVRRVVHTFFERGDLRRPGAFEHYDALRGHASVYRGYDDLQRAAASDLLLQWIAGVRPHVGGVVVDPLPAGLESVEVSALCVRGRELAVRADRERVHVSWGAETHEAPLGTPIALSD